MTQASFQLRPAEPRDTAQIVELIGALAEYEKLSHRVQVTPEMLSRHLFGERPLIETLVAQSEPGRLIGFALYFTNFSTFLGKPGLYLEDLFVRQEHRGHGVGRALLETLARIALERDYGRVEWSVLDWNAPAIGFYEQLGASVLPEWRICRLTGAALERFRRA
jgi:GNAT superfamily N-acetyltransferase